MTQEHDRWRRWRIAVWLLMPFVVWAASFLGGWIGAALAVNAGHAAVGPVRLAVGALGGGVIGLALCLIVVWALRRRDPARTGDDQ